MLEALAAVREQRPDAWYVCDPVLGDEGELYLPAELVRTFREQAVPRADLLVPNRFELEWLVDRPVASVAEAVAAAGELHAAGAREVVVKGLVLDHDGRPTQHVVGLDDDGAWLARAPHVAQFWSGAGDVFTALIAGLRLPACRSARRSRRATALMEQLIARTHELGAPELRMVEIDWAAEPRRRARRARGLTAQPREQRRRDLGRDVAAREHEHRARQRLDEPREQRGDGRGGGRLDGQLGARVEEAEALGDLLLADDDGLVEQLLEHCQRARPMLGGPSASAIVTPAGRGTGRPAAMDVAERRDVAGSTPITRAPARAP